MFDGDFQKIESKCTNIDEQTGGIETIVFRITTYNGQCKIDVSSSEQLISTSKLI